MNCNIHQDNEAVNACVYCGKFFCQDCLVDIKGRSYCKEHAEKAVDDLVNTTIQQPNIVINNENNNNMIGNFGVSPKSRLVSLLLCLFLGVLGIHRFYAGKVGTGILYLLTGGLCGVGVLIDFILIVVGSFKDQYGMAIKIW